MKNKKCTKISKIDDNLQTKPKGLKIYTQIKSYSLAKATENIY